MVDNAVHVPVITLDGPSGTGKGTLCHRLAEPMFYRFFSKDSIKPDKSLAPDTLIKKQSKIIYNMI